MKRNYPLLLRTEVLSLYTAVRILILSVELNLEDWLLTRSLQSVCKGAATKLRQKPGHRNR